ncbi:hypothetical protein CAPTEDRAFT_101392 [Capitella teleta]|uniref:Uncharacterized protein n=1 Tax=Capitella teleta TaxID=283909 RepID=R7TAA7_CAPTE|nr:hypothetical protein CAPTEDRAFT_101392 [Capitella teleta]|eukprot:ELT90644.1 hypothetical protein CAPTEDRAFT_101392 [Capitella teleta]
MGSSASKSPGGRRTIDPPWGCLHRKHKSSPEHTKTGISEPEDDPDAVSETSTGNQNQNRNQSQNIVHQPEVINANSSERLGASDFKIIKLKAVIDKSLTTIDEKSNAVLKYRTPHFRALATVEIPALEAKQGIQIGWIQTCLSMHFVNQYGTEGLTSWEFPEIVLNKYKMISDADGKLYPWYGSKHEVQTIHGPTSSSTPVTVHMNDNFFPQVTWYIPHNQYSKTPRLTHIYRKQKFYTFLVAKNLETDNYHILKTILWRMELSIEVNPANPLGKRATLVGPASQEPPLVLASNPISLPDYATQPPNANNSQTLVWRPFKGEPMAIVPPIETTINMEKYLRSTKHHRFKCSMDRMQQHQLSEQ